MSELPSNDYLVEELENQLKSSIDDRDNLKNLIDTGHAYVQSIVGQFDLSDKVGKKLVFDWCRFEWNGYGEHFDDNFAKALNGFRWQLWMDGEPDVEET